MINVAFQRVVDWRVKNRFLKDQISNLEKLGSFPIIGISMFLLKTQLVEFELKQLITAIDLHAHFRGISKHIKTRTPKDLDDQKMTLGVLKNEIYRYRFKFLNKLKSDLSELVKIRNEFVHGLFNPGSLGDVIKNSKKGLQVVNKVAREIENVENFLKENDPLEKL